MPSLPLRCVCAIVARAGSGASEAPSLPSAELMLASDLECKPHRIWKESILGAGLEPRSGDNYTRLLEALFLIRRLPAWGRTLRSRTAHSPKPSLSARSSNRHHGETTFATSAIGEPITIRKSTLSSKPMTEVSSDSRSKQAEKLIRRGLRGLATLRDALGDQFRAGFFLNSGTEAYCSDRIYVCPIDRLWQTNRTMTERAV
jgi:hypothetical protein